jgi:hypothetical protein
MSPLLIPEFHPLDPEGELYYNDIKELAGRGKYEIQFQVGQVLQIVIRNPNNGIVATVSPPRNSVVLVSVTDFST